MAEPADDELDRVAPATDAGAASEGAQYAETDSLVERVKDLAEDTRTAIEAELAWQGARASYLGGNVGGLAGWAALAVLCVFIALLSLAFGAILALTPLIGAALATLAVVVVLLVGAAIAGLIARSRMGRIKAIAFPARPGATP